MTLALPSLRVGDPIRHGPLAVFPLFGDDAPTASYRLSVDGLVDGSVVVEEVGEEGIVGALEVENRGAEPALFLEGEELVGAKQDRVVNTTVLVAARHRLRVPVSCVEHGRWAYRSNRMMQSGVHSPSMVRHALKSSVSLSLREGLAPLSNQAEIWESVARLHAGHDVACHTGAMGATFGKRSEEVERYREALRYVPGARGLAVALEDRIVAIDAFDRPDTCEKVWDRLLSGAVLDALLAPDGGSSVGADAVETLIAGLRGATWEPVKTVGAGREWRAALGPAHASALVYEGVVVHESVTTG